MTPPPRELIDTLSLGFALAALVIALWLVIAMIAMITRWVRDRMDR